MFYLNVALIPEYAPDIEMLTKYKRCIRWYRNDDKVHDVKLLISTHRYTSLELFL